jgi:4-hydroxybenzoyl-CoA thioesterase
VSKEASRTPGVHEHPLEVHFGDCDPAGIVYFPRFFDFFHRAMESWFGRALGLPYDDLILREKIGFPAVHTEADFRSPCRFGEKLVIELRLARLGRTSLTLAYSVRAESGGEARLTGQTVCAVMDLDPTHATHMRAIALPDALRQKMQDFGPLRQ